MFVSFLASLALFLLVCSDTVTGSEGELGDDSVVHFFEANCSAFNEDDVQSCAQFIRNQSRAAAELVREFTECNMAVIRDFLGPEAPERDDADVEAHIAADMSTGDEWHDQPQLSDHNYEQRENMVQQTDEQLKAKLLNSAQQMQTSLVAGRMFQNQLEGKSDQELVVGYDREREKTRNYMLRDVQRLILSVTTTEYAIRLLSMRNNQTLPNFCQIPQPLQALKLNDLN